MTGSPRIFRTSVPEGFEWALPMHASDFEAIRTLADRSLGSAWKPIRMSLLRSDDRGQPQRRAQMPWLGSEVLVLRDEAVDTVGALLLPHGEVLPLDCDDARLSLFSAPTIAGALDRDRSDMAEFSSGRIMSLRRPAFIADALNDKQAFKLAEMPRGDLYLADDLVKAILDTGMSSGTDFTPC